MLFFILQMKKQIKEVIFKQIPNFFGGGLDMAGSGSVFELISPNLVVYHLTSLFKI